MGLNRKSHRHCPIGARSCLALTRRRCAAAAAAARALLPLSRTPLACRHRRLAASSPCSPTDLVSPPPPLSPSCPRAAALPPSPLPQERRCASRRRYHAAQRSRRRCHPPPLRAPCRRSPRLPCASLPLPLHAPIALCQLLLPSALRCCRLACCAACRFAPPRLPASAPLLQPACPPLPSCLLSSTSAQLTLPPSLSSPLSSLSLKPLPSHSISPPSPLHRLPLSHAGAPL